LYYLPIPQTLSTVQMLRGGSRLLYGPEPQPVINFISRTPDPNRPWSGTDRRYYSRVFISRGLLEPGKSKTFYAGVAYDF
jgi:hypothetical protein